MFHPPQTKSWSFNLRPTSNKAWAMRDRTIHFHGDRVTETEMLPDHRTAQRAVDERRVAEKKGER